MKKTSRHIELQGTSKQVGAALAQSAPEARLNMMKNGEELPAEDMREIVGLFDRFCPGLNEELQGFADAAGAPPARVAFYAATLLRPSCCQIAIRGRKAQDGHVILGRSYEYHHDFEDFTLARTAVTGRYAHLGTSVCMFGREEGINERGLAVAMSMNGTRELKARGLMFWAALRAVLENCADVEEGLQYLAQIPIAYNMNMLLADKAGRVALYETMDGGHDYQRLEADDVMFATNHPLLPSIIAIDPYAGRHSLVRYETIGAFLREHNGITMDALRDFLLTMYPDGPCCHNYEEYMGTTKTVVMDVTTGTLGICWGGRIENGWYEYVLDRPLEYSTHEIELDMSKGETGMYDRVPLA